MRTTVTLLALWLTAFAASAQSPPQPPISALDKQALDLAFEAADVWNAEATALPSYRRFQRHQAYVNAMLKERYPYLVVNWPAKRLEPQGATK